MIFVYSLLYMIVVLVLLPFEYSRRPKELRKRWLREKFGNLNAAILFGKTAPPAGGNAKGAIWIHAVSVGEVMAASALLGNLKERYPDRRLILSTITDTGRKVAGERAPEGTAVVYLPLDIPFIQNRVIKKISPELLIVIETELWPNLIRVFREHGIPVLLLNGRISEKSFKGYRRIRFFMKTVLSHVDFFGMQSDEYAERIRELGASRERIITIGNFKFDISPPAKIPEWTNKLRGPVVTAGSTHEGEEDLLAAGYSALKENFPDLTMIIAPRHPERFRGVEEMLRARNILYMKRSVLDDSASSPSVLQGMVILLDTVGELSAVYSVSDIAIIGKSFRGHGGQNPLEPAYWGKPIVCGPHMENFPVIAQFYQKGAAVEVREDALFPKIEELLLAPEKAGRMGITARELYAANTGAVGKAMEIIAGFLK